MTDAEFWLLVQRKVARLEPDLARAVLEGFDRLRPLLSPGDMERLIRSASIDRLLSETLDEATLREAFRRIEAQLQRTFMESLVYMAKRVPGAEAVFNVLNPRVVEALRGLNTKAMGSLATSVREVVRAHVEAGLEAGTNPRTIARGVRDVVGLAPQHASAVARFRAELEAGDLSALDRALGRGVLRTPSGGTVTRPAHAGGYGLGPSSLARLERRLRDGTLTPAQIDRTVATYERRLKGWHAETVARTAALDAMKAGHRLSWLDAVDRGVIKRTDLFRRWSGVMDSRERPSHKEMEGEVAHVDEAYSNGQMVPGDDEYNCRCLDRFFVRRNLGAAA